VAYWRWFTEGARPRIQAWRRRWLTGSEGMVFTAWLIVDTGQGSSSIDRLFRSFMKVEHNPPSLPVDGIDEAEPEPGSPKCTQSV
jgi:hypothetical protein